VPAGNYQRDGKANYGERMQNMYSLINAGASLSPRCVASLGFRCLFAPNAIAFIDTPVFALNSRYDASMASGHYGDDESGGTNYSCTSYTGEPCDYRSVNNFGSFVAARMKAALVAPHGAFLDSCYRHCSVNCRDYDITIGGVKAAQAAAAWYKGGGAAAFHDGNATFPCVDCCA
jgi:hypothetical protein